MSLLSTFMDLDRLYERLDRETLISNIKNSGRSYNFDKYSDEHLYRIWERIQKEVEEKAAMQEYRDTLNAEQHEACSECGAYLNDSGTCPVCDDGEEALYETLKHSLMEDSPSKLFVELPTFSKNWKKNGLTDEDLYELQNLIIEKPESAEPLGAGVSKIRFIPSRLNRGKNALYRVFYIEIIKVDKIYLATVLNKSDDANISDTELKILKALADKLKTGDSK